MDLKRCAPFIKLFFLPSLTLAVILLSSYYTGKVSSQARALKLNNKTHSFEVATVETNNGRVRLTLKNNYSKTITAYAISSSSTSHNLRELDAPMTPGSSGFYDLKMSPEANITVLAVVFEDGTSDGDATVAKEINDYRNGKRIQYGRIVPLLNKILAARDEKLQTALEKAHSAVQALPTDSDQDSHFVLAGLRDAKESMLADIGDWKQFLQTGDTNILRERIARLNHSLQTY